MLFQFHKGTIKTIESVKNYRVLANFNSIKVQLKQISTFRNRLFYIFQFHKGTIKTCDSLCYDIVQKYFNSIKVQLKHKSKNL